ncbi:transketolase [Candidatus Contubernalis alkaliaceticus]|uniref:transketolase n=1 Tax=Candidatus Contubernalis alkaliaceticus TaxID=338645 RepID=UPI001F4C3623|nr:transketolase [Candidatus Contubernalis alkalaceticus]UNC90772.1 transketolase [Candidatus Contubernalis alkalaceticus]
MANTNQVDFNYLAKKAVILRKNILRMIGEAGSGHPGGSLSAADILTVLYFKVLKVDPDNPRDPDRDRFVLSKGHGAPALYAALAEKGFFPQEELWKLRKINSFLQGHPDMKRVPGVEMSTGSLGQGLSAANGMALAARVMGKDYRVFVLLGDGECQEGQVWEAAMTAAHYKLDNLTAFLDYNGLQIDGPCAEIKSPLSFKEKWEAFGWEVIEIDGHDLKQIWEACQEALTVKEKPTMVVCRTIKGRGVSFMENMVDWHGKAPDKEQLEKALSELEGGSGGYEAKNCHP